MIVRQTSNGLLSINAMLNPLLDTLPPNSQVQGYTFVTKDVDRTAFSQSFLKASLQTKKRGKNQKL